MTSNDGTGGADIGAAAGDIIVVDFRPPESRGRADAASGGCGAPSLRCVQWNIERGYELDKVIALLLHQDADIIALQELDIGCDRSFSRDCVREIASALKMKCAFYVEFEELRSPLRSPQAQGGGVHGNAILSRYDFSPYVVSHSYHPLNWTADGHSLLEPRRGERAILAAEIFIPGLPSAVVCYCLHLEVFCGIIGRLKQFCDVFADSHAKRRNGKHFHQIILGDLNTMAHSIARMSPKYCRDFLRFWSIGLSEGAFWEKYLFNVLHDGTNLPNHRLMPLCPRHFSLFELRTLRNSFFFDPYSTYWDMTLSNYCGLFQGKLDWCLFRGFHVKSYSMANINYEASDHRLLCVLVEPLLLQDCADPGPAALQTFHEQHDCKNIYSETAGYSDDIRSSHRSDKLKKIKFCIFGAVAIFIILRKKAKS